jgi:hypothetical protein
MKKRLALSATVLVLTMCVIVFFFHPTKGGDISYASYQKLTKGMTRKQVEDILGGPARDEVPTTRVARTGVWPWEEWCGREGVVYVEFDAADRVRDFGFHRHTAPPIEPSFAERVRSWLPW